MNATETILIATKTNAVKMIKENLSINDKWVVSAVLAIYARQTAAEQSIESTVDANGIGFSGADGEILSSFAKQILEFNSGRSRFRQPLSPKQFGMARKKIIKYAGQLLSIMKEKADLKRRQADVARTLEMAN